MWLRRRDERYLQWKRMQNVRAQMLGKQNTYRALRKMQATGEVTCMSDNRVKRHKFWGLR